MCSTCRAMAGGTGSSPASTRRGQAGHFAGGAGALLFQHGVHAAHEAVVARRAARVGGDLAFQPAREQGAHAQGAEGGQQHVEVFGVRVGGDDHGRPGAGVHQLDDAVARVAQAHHLAHGQQAGQAGVQVLRVDVAHRAVCYFFRSC